MENTINTRKEAFDKFKLAALASFEEELDALLSGMENEDEIHIDIRFQAYNKIGNRYDDGVKHREASYDLSLCNPKTEKDLKPVKEDSQNGTEL